MANSRVIKNRIRSVTNTGKITKTMAMVSTAKATKVVTVIKSSRPYAEKLNGILSTLGTGGSDSHPLLKKNTDANRKLLVVFTANRGLCGGYNANAIKMAKENVSENTDIIMFGKKGIGSFKFSKIAIFAENIKLKDLPSFDDAKELADEVMGLYESGEYSEVSVIYTKYFSAGVQKIVKEKVFPFSIESGEGDKNAVDPIFMPNKEKLLASLIPKLVRVSFYKFIMDTSASEHLARQMAMNSAADNAKDMVKSLTLSYNRARQAQITTEIAEIVGGAEAL